MTTNEKHQDKNTIELLKRIVKIRLYPNETQKKQIQDILNGCNFVYNKYLEYNINLYKEFKESGDETKKSFISAYDYSKILTQLKKTDEKYMWLQDIYVAALKDALCLAEKSYKAYFKKQAKYPHFKSAKRDNGFTSYFIPKQGIKLYQDKPELKNKIKLPILGDIRVTSKEKLLPSQEVITSARVIKTPTDKYYAMFIYEKENSISDVEYTDGLFINLGFDNYVDVCTESGERFSKPSLLYDEAYCKIDNRITHFQQIIYNKGLINQQHLIEDYMERHNGEEPSNEYKERLLRQGLSSGNIMKVRKKLNLAYERRSNYSKDYICKLVHELVKNRPAFIIINKFECDDDADTITKVNRCRFFEFKERLRVKCEEYKIEYLDLN